jgi:hypothetical protein
MIDEYKLWDGKSLQDMNKKELIEIITFLDETVKKLVKERLATKYA